MTEPAHPDAELTAFAADALGGAERARVAAHLASCAGCRRTVEESRAVLAGLAASLPAPPATDWRRYGAALRARVESGRRRVWWLRPVPVVLAAGVATAVVVLAIDVLDHRPVELAAVEETMLGARLPLLQQYRVVERLDLLEDLETIRQLDRLAHEER